jgi:hypothetical protein
MLNLKKTAVAVLAFGSSAVFAGTMGPVCTPGNVTVPCPSTGWAFGAQALYLKPSFSGYGYYGSTVAGNSETYNSNPNNWGWGFKLEGAYYFNTGNDLNLNWYHFDHTTNTSATSVSFFAPLDLGLTTLTSVSASAQPKWDAVNLEFGQLAHFGEFKNIRFHGGVEWARVETNLNASGTVTSVGGVAVAAAPGSVSSNLKFDGFGPRIGADYAYNWGNGLAMYANGASSLLVGSQKFNDSVTSTTLFGAATPTFTRSGSATYIVPELEAKLGLTYTYAMAQGDLSLDVGWMWVNYFNALHDATAAGLGDTRTTNFAVQGPYIGLKWIGNVA